MDTKIWFETYVWTFNRKSKIIMKRILVIITTAFTATGGLASVMLNYYRSLDKKGLQIDFASTNTITSLEWRTSKKW